MVLIIKMVKKSGSSKTAHITVKTGGEELPKKVGRPREILSLMEKKFTLLLPRDLHKTLKIKSAEMETPMTTLIIDAIKKTYNI